MGNNIKEEYNEYINNSVEWQKKREECFNLFGRQCKVCGITKKIHVHHKTYARFKDENVEEDLVPLCEKHHKALHKYCKKYNRPLLKGSNEYLEGRIPKKENRRQRRMRERREKKKKNKGKVKIRQPKYLTLPNDVSTFKPMVSVSLED